MFARHTRARRMKKTGVVQGLKSLADKIHPNGNAPLTAGESKRLLTALTSSFRRHLDAAHPTTIADDRKLRAEGQGQHSPQVTASGIHSSAAFAQRHMASVLTNPLLVKFGKSYASAKTELAAHKDPIELLEEYDRDGAATVRIAELCLDKVRKDYDSVSTERRSEMLKMLRPGRRVFDWLFQSGLYATQTLADNVRFIDQLAFFLVHEGQQEMIWLWLRMNFKAPAGPEGAPINRTQSVRKFMLYQYRWRGRVLLAFIQHTVGVTRDVNPKKTQPLSASNLHRGLDILFDAQSLQQSALTIGHPIDWHHLFWFPLAQAASFLSKLLTTRITTKPITGDVSLVDGERIDPSRFDRLIECKRSLDVLASRLNIGLDAFGKALAETALAELQMVHPKTPSGEYMLEILRTLMPDERANSYPKLNAELATNDANRRRWGHQIIRCASLLAKHGKHDDAAWVRARIPLYVPDLTHKLESEVRRKTTVSAGANSGTANGLALLPFIRLGASQYH